MWGPLLAACLIACGTAAPGSPAPPYDAVVDGATTTDGAAVGGIATYRTVTRALDGAPANATRPYRIFVRDGRYYEKLIVAKAFIALIGQSRDGTILTYDTVADTKRPDGGTYGTSGSASVTVRAADFRAENITIDNGFDHPANAAKPSDDPTRFANAQAVALKTERGSDRAVFVNVKITGHQDTLFVDAGRHYFSRCSIAGSVDFIFGAGQAVFEDCDIVSRDRGSTTNNGYVTAASTDVSRPNGLVFIRSRLKKETLSLADGTVALGRPWHPTKDLPDGTRAADPNAVASVVYVDCFMDSHIAAKGWESMTGRDKDGKTITFQPGDARFFEFGSAGPGAKANPARHTLSAKGAERYTIPNTLEGWDPRR